MGIKKLKILLITRCSRPQNLELMKQSILRSFNNTKFEPVWFIIFDLNRVEKDEVLEFKEEWIHTKQIKSNIVYACDLLNIALFDEISNDCIYSYLFDDDNILMDNMVSLIPIDKHDKIVVWDMYLSKNLPTKSLKKKLKNLEKGAYGKIDASQFVLPIKQLKEVGGYVQSQGTDGKTFDKVAEKCKIHYTKKVGAYYNRLTNEGHHGTQDSKEEMEDKSRACHWWKFLK